MNCRFCTLLFFIFGTILCSNAQLRDLQSRQDSATKSIYNNLYEFSQQEKFYRGIYRLFFRKPETTTKSAATKPKYRTMYADAEGKIIRNITIMSKSPFDVVDSVDFFSGKNLEKTANYLHINTQKFVIHNLLMFKKNEVFDSLAVKESERLIRSQRYIDRARILVVPTVGDSVDVIVQTRDEFSLIPNGELSSSTFGIGLKERNFFGLGHQAHAFYEWKINGDVDYYQYDYHIPNILNTYINTDLVYRWQPTDSSEVKRFSLSRPFYSPLVRWAGGAELFQQAERKYMYVPFSDSAVIQPFRYNVYDFWGAYAIKSKSRSMKSRSRNLILSARYYHIDYHTSPLPEYDPYNTYSREDLYLFGIGFSERSYRQDSYLFKFGYTEDVPVGQVYSLTAGVQHKNDKNRFYLAAKAAHGTYFRSGYWGYKLEYGSFFNGKDIEEGVSTLEVNYFTPLLEFGGWKFRQFAKSQMMYGINRLPTERLSLSSNYGITGFNSAGLNGTHKAIFAFQSQFFTPWNLWGFRIAPYFVYIAGMLGNDRNGFFRSRLYSLLGTGILFRNDHLVFNSFELSFSFFPYMPNDGHNFYKFNSYSATDFSFRDFDIEKPEKIVYE